VPFWQYSEELDESVVTTNWWTENEPWYLIYHASGSAQRANRDKVEAALMYQAANAILADRVKLEKRSKIPRRTNMPISKGVYRPGQRPRRGFYRRGGL
jgi:predicted TIM-barrel enzyme